MLCFRWFHETQQPLSPGLAATQGSAREVFASQSFRAWASLATATFGGLFCFLLFSPMVYIGYLGFTPSLYGWIPAGGSLVYIGSTTPAAGLLRRFGAVRAVQYGALLSLAGPLGPGAGLLAAADQCACRCCWPCAIASGTASTSPAARPVR